MAQSSRPFDHGVTVGQVLVGKYRVDAIIGHGASGVVAECTHLTLDERVAIKMLRPDVVHDPDAVHRFVREAQAAAKLKSEYVAHVSDVGTFDNGVPYMVMEYLEGYDLGRLLEERKVLPVPWAVELALQAAEALAEAHSHAIVHRDVKPTNLFVTWRPDGSALMKVLDFGISKAPMGTDLQLTQTQSLLGTPAYMSPEQMRSARTVDSRSDIWSLGTVLYEVIEGRRPFEAESFSEMCVKVAVDAPTPMVQAPPELHPIIMRCLSKAPELRYASMAELGRDLAPFAQDPQQAGVLVERMTRVLRRAQGDAGTDPAVSEPAVSSPRLAPARKRRWPYVVLAGALVGAGAAALVLVRGAHDDRAPVTTDAERHVAPPPPRPAETKPVVKPPAETKPVPAPIVKPQTTPPAPRPHPPPRPSASQSQGSAAPASASGSAARSGCDPWDAQHDCSDR